MRVLTDRYNNVLSALTLSQPSRKRHEHHSDRVWFLVPHAREKVEYFKTVHAYDQEAKKKHGLNSVNTSKENKNVFDFNLFICMFS